MLEVLRVKNYVLMDSLEVEFPEGLVIITGQTGAGKSILLGALSLVLGSKADASVIGDSAENCVVEAEFHISNEDARKILEDNDVDWDGGNLTLRRVISKTGRSRSFINDSPVNLAVLSSLSSYLVDIHSQHQTLLLSDRNFQLSLLDHYAANGELLKLCFEAYSRQSALEYDIKELEERIRFFERDKDYNEAQYRQLEAAGIKEGELAALEEEQKKLANAEEIKEHLCTIDSLSAGFSEEYTLVSALKEIERRLEKVSAFLPSLSSFASRVETCRLELEDVLSDVSDANEGIDVSQERLEQVEDRIGTLYSFMKKHGCSDEKELVALKESLSEGISGCEALYDRKEELTKELEVARMHVNDICGRLHKARCEASGSFSAIVTESIRNLELPYAVFEVEVSDAPLSSKGRDSLLFKFSAGGKNPVDVAKCASGGELSRIMLCLKDMMARYTNMPTMVFDEIDTGVSGSVADKMGSMICSMGANMQVFAITHLPQVAAKGDAHYLVSKDMSENKSVSSIKKLSAEQRVLEVARMLSGSSLTEAAIANAKSLLNN